MQTKPSLSQTKPSLSLRRRLGAPPAKVFAAWTDPEKIIHWFGPGDARCVHEAKIDARLGGRYWIRFSTEDGEEHGVGGVYREFVPNERLVFTWAWRTMPERESLVTVALKPDGDGTVLILTHEQFADEPARDRHRTGWTGTLDKLDRYLTVA